MTLVSWMALYPAVTAIFFLLGDWLATMPLAIRNTAGDGLGNAVDELCANAENDALVFALAVSCLAQPQSLSVAATVFSAENSLVLAQIQF